MKLEVKPSLIIIGTLLIGMVLGALTLATVVHHRMERLHALRTRGGMPQHLLAAIGPLSAQQGAVTMELERTAAQIDSTIQSSHRFIAATLDSMASRVDSLLTPEQRVRLHRELDRRIPGGPEGPGGPPFGGRPPRGPRPGDRPDEPPPPER